MPSGLLRKLRALSMARPKRALEREDLRVEARAGDHVGEQILDVVERARLRHGGGQVEDLLLEQELLFVVQHGSGMVHRERGEAGLLGALWSPMSVVLSGRPLVRREGRP